MLQGLLDTDGGPVTQAGRTCRIQYTTTSIVLRDDVVELVQSLGGVAYYAPRDAAGVRRAAPRGARWPTGTTRTSSKSGCPRASSLSG